MVTAYGTYEAKPCEKLLRARQALLGFTFHSTTGVGTEEMGFVDLQDGCPVVFYITNQVRAIKTEGGRERSKRDTLYAKPHARCL